LEIESDPGASVGIERKSFARQSTRFVRSFVGMLAKSLRTKEVGR
jgi:hypothetical protein